MEVCSLASGETLAFCNAEDLEGKSVKEVKQLLAAQLGVPRFRQRLFLENGSVEISDDEILGPGTLKVWLVLLAFERTVGSADYEMMEAIATKNTELLEQRLQCPCDPNLQSGVHSHSPLFIAVQHGNLEMIRLLVEAGADVNGANALGRSPLLLAVICDNVEIARLLLGAGADSNQTTTDDGVSPLWIAAQLGHLQMVRLLLAAGADKTLTARNHYSPLQVAVQHGHLAVASVLRLWRKRTRAMAED